MPLPRLLRAVAALAPAFLFAACGSREDPETARIEAMLRVGMFAEAAERLSEAVAAAPEDARLHHQLARARLGVGDGEGARISFERALRLDAALGAEVGEAYLVEAARALEAGAEAEARAWSGEAVHLHPGSRGAAGELWRDQALGRIVAGAVEDGLAAAEVAVAFDSAAAPALARAVARAGAERLGAGEMEEGMAALRAAAELHPEGAVAAGDAARARLRAGLLAGDLPARALAPLLDRAREGGGVGSDGSPEAELLRAAAAYAAGDEAGAVAALEALRTRFPASQEGALAARALLPLSPGTRLVPDLPALEVRTWFNTVRVRLAAVEAGEESLRFHLELSAPDRRTFLLYEAENAPDATRPAEMHHLLSRQGEKAYCRPRLEGGRQERFGRHERTRQVRVEPGETVRVTAVCPLPAAGATRVRYVAPALPGVQGAWGWEVRLRESLLLLRPE